MPDLPPAEDVSLTPASPAAPASPGGPPAPPPRRRNWSVGGVVGGGCLVLLLLYGLAGFLREAGLYDVRRAWTTDAPSPHLGAWAPAAPATPPKPPARPREELTPAPAPAGAVRDPPPLMPQADTPKFTVRDGEKYDFLFNLDEETLKRLGDMQGQLDGLVQLVTRLQQTVEALARQSEGDRRRSGDALSGVYQEVRAARQDLLATQGVVEELEARVKRSIVGIPPGGAGFNGAGNAARAVPGWAVTAISGNRAWLRTPKGAPVTVVAGERLKTLGLIRAVDPLQGIVVLSDGRVVR